MRTWRPTTLLVSTWYPRILLLLYVSFHRGLWRWTCCFLRVQTVLERKIITGLSWWPLIFLQSQAQDQLPTSHHPSLGIASSASSSNTSPGLRLILHPQHPWCRPLPPSPAHLGGCTSPHLSSKGKGSSSFSLSLTNSLALLWSVSMLWTRIYQWSWDNSICFSERKYRLNCPWWCGTTELQPAEELQQHLGINWLSKALVLKANKQPKQTLFVGNGGRKVKNNSGGKLHQLFSTPHLLLY